MWGKGLYFAVKAGYSNDYKFKNSDGKTFSFFYAKVALGKSTPSIISDKSLKHPPFKDGNKTEKYDSVKGETNGSDIFVIYENSRAYPQYLIYLITFE